MNRRPDEERVAELLATLTESDRKPPSADAAYLQARIRMVLEQERRRRAEALIPLRRFHRGMGLVALVAAVALVVATPTVGFIAAPLSISAVALAALLLSESTADRVG